MCVCVSRHTYICVHSVSIQVCVYTHTLRRVLLRTYASLAAQRGSPPATRAGWERSGWGRGGLADLHAPWVCCDLCASQHWGFTRTPGCPRTEEDTETQPRGSLFKARNDEAVRSQAVCLLSRCLLRVLCHPSDGTERSSRESPLDMAPTWSSERQHWAEQWPLTTESTPDPCGVSKLSTACPAGVCLLASRDGELTT